MDWKVTPAPLLDPGMTCNTDSAINQLCQRAKTVAVLTLVSQYAKTVIEKTRRYGLLASSVLVSSARSHARAILQSRLTVSTETRRTSAASSLLNPPK